MTLSGQQINPNYLRTERKPKICRLFSAALIVITCSVLSLSTGCIFQTDAKAPHTLLFMGNSITRMDSIPQFGWLQSNGMAATALDSDYVHVTLRLLDERGIRANAVIGDRDCEICDGEVDAHAETARRHVLQYRPLAVVVQLGENATPAEVDGGQLTEQYRRLLQGLTDAGAKRIYALSVWDDTSLTAPKTFAVRRAIREFPDVRFLDLTDIPKQPGVYGDSSQYENPAVLWHPGNAGMRLIGERVAEAIAGDF
jgi:hypothetical protein